MSAAGKVASYPAPTRVQMRRDHAATVANSLPPGEAAIDYINKRLNVGVDTSISANGFLSFLTTAEAANDYLPLAGGVLTGPLTLAANAATNLQPTTLQQMNAAITAGVNSGLATLPTASAIAAACMARMPCRTFDRSPHVCIPSNVMSHSHSNSAKAAVALRALYSANSSQRNFSETPAVVAASARGVPRAISARQSAARRSR